MNRQSGRKATLAYQSLIRLAIGMCALGASLDGARAQPRELWKISADGGGLARFADTPGYTCGSPDWSPDGNTIMLVRTPPNTTLQNSMTRPTNVTATP